MMLPMNATMMMDDRLNLDNKQTWDDSWLLISRNHSYVFYTRCYSFVSYTYHFLKDYPDRHKKIVRKYNAQLCL